MHAILLCIALPSILVATVNDQPPARTTLSDPNLRYEKAKGAYVVLKRGPIEAVVVNNQAVDDSVLPRHCTGYNGVASLKHTHRQQNLFVPLYAGLNFEHILDGTMQPRKVLFEPRNAAMELRLIDSTTAELYQPPTPHYKLESCTRYRLLDDGTIEMTFECIPRAKTFQHGYIGLFWASYIHQPQSTDIYFRGRSADEPNTVDRWIRSHSPAHGQSATHLALGDRRQLPHDPKFPLELPFCLSNYRYSEPWYFGTSHGLALAQVFRPQDAIRLTQSPSGAGPGNPAWDFQYIIPSYEIGRRYQSVMRAVYLPYQSPDQVSEAVVPHRAALALSP